MIFTRGSMDSFVRPDDLPPGLLEGDGDSLLVIVGNLDSPAGAVYLLTRQLPDQVFHVQAFISQAGSADSDFYSISQLDGRLVIQLHPGQDEADLQKGFTIPETEMADVSHPGMFQVGDKSCIVDMTLRVQIPIANVDWTKETEI